MGRGAALIRRVLEHGLRPAEAAQAMEVSVRTAYQWPGRYREAGETGLINRSSQPWRRRPQAIRAARCDEVIKRRYQRQTCRQIAQSLVMGHSTVGRLLMRNGLNRLVALVPAGPDNHYAYDAPAGPLALDIKKRGRFERPGHRVAGNCRQQTRDAGREAVHAAIDDHSRIAFSSVHADETGPAMGDALR